MKSAKKRRTLGSLVSDLFQKEDHPSALVCAADWVARSLMPQMSEMGWAVPEDVSLVGFGEEGRDLVLGKRISTVCVDRAGMGTVAADLLLAEIRDPTVGPQRRVMSADLALYDTVAAPKRKRM